MMPDFETGGQVPIVKTQHAPGPWKYGYGEVYDYDGEQVALLPLRNQNEPEINGRLIAAAPELLEVLQAWQRLVNNLTDGGVLKQAFIAYAPLAETDAAVAKATGVQS